MWTQWATVSAICLYPTRGLSTACWRWAKTLRGAQTLQITNTSNILPNDY